MADVVLSAADGWGVTPRRDGDALGLDYTCRCAATGSAPMVPEQCGGGQHATDVTCSGCGEVGQVVWRTVPDAEE